MDGSCPNRTDVESWGAQLEHIWFRFSRGRADVVSSFGCHRKKEVPKHLQLLLWFGISLAKAFAQPIS